MAANMSAIEGRAVSLFGPFALDTQRAAVTRHGAGVPLRPKTFALLSYFAAHPGRVIGKDELLAAVWPGVVVNEESLSQCVRELRAALGDDGPAMIKTVARRGYLFDAAVEAPAPPQAAATAPQGKRHWARWALGGAALFAGLLLAARWEPPPAAVEPAASARRAIAVMPFSAPASDRQDYFAEAVTEDLASGLAKLPDTLVVAPASVTVAAARATDVRVIGRELGVSHVLGGSVRRDGAAVQIDAQLVSSANGAVLWSERFDYRSVADWAWQRDIASRIGRALNVRMSTAAAGPPGPHHGQRLDAIDEALQGWQQLRHASNLVDLRRARTHFENALAIEPNSASALSGLAQSHLSEVDYRWSTNRDNDISVAEQAIARVLAAEPDHLVAQRLSADALRERRDLEAALKAYQKVVAANPGDAWGHARIGFVKLMLARPEEVAVHMDAALRLSPREATLVGYANVWRGVAEFYLGRHDAAYEHMRRSAAAGPGPNLDLLFGTYLWMASLDALHGREQEAAQHAAQVMRLEPGWRIAKWRARTMLLHPRMEAGRERFAEGMRKAGLPE